MGRHSNIILIDKATQTIIDSIKRVYSDMSKVREVLPGRQYVYPPLQEKLNINNLSLPSFKEAVNNYKSKKLKNLSRYFTRI